MDRLAQMGARRRGARRRWWAAGAVAATAALVATALPPAVADHPSTREDRDESEATALHLVTLQGPGVTGHRDDEPVRVLRRQMLKDQNRLLAAVNAPAPVYRWTTALNGFAVSLDSSQARTLAGHPDVAAVEQNQIHDLATVGPARHRAAAVARQGRGGAGTVIGFVDSGIDPDHRAFSDVAPLGPAPRFRGECTVASGDPSWDRSACGEKLVGAQYFVRGFGADRVRSGESLSPQDTDGHGTQMASIAAGSAGTPVRIDDEQVGSDTGTAPRARVAAYKACWSAPDPTQDGCATADLVAAIDRAAADRVDVLNLAVAGPSRIDTVERALLGATEAGAVVVAAAGNRGDDGYAAHPSPWVTTVGATTGAVRVGHVRVGSLDLRGRMAAGETVTEARLVFAADAAAPDADVRDARVCREGTLDAQAVAGAVVVCERGATARVAKSRAVQRADGAGMILINTARDSVNADLHAVPTVHLPAAAARRLAHWAADRDAPRVDLVADGLLRRPPRVADFSSGGNPRQSVLKPDLVAPGSEVMAAVPDGWDLATGTSAAAAHVSGLAARLLARPATTAAEVRSALVTSTRPVDQTTGVAASGAGRATDAAPPPVSFLVPERHYRRWLDGDRAAVNQAHALLRGDHTRVVRSLTNTSDRTVQVAAATEGFSTPVRVFPAWAELAPGDRLTFHVTLADPTSVERGSVIWRTGGGRAARLTVVSTR